MSSLKVSSNILSTLPERTPTYLYTHSCIDSALKIIYQPNYDIVNRLLQICEIADEMQYFKIPGFAWLTGLREQVASSKNEPYRGASENVIHDHRRDLLKDAFSLLQKGFNDLQYSSDTCERIRSKKSLINHIKTQFDQYEKWRIWDLRNFFGISKKINSVLNETESV